MTTQNDEHEARHDPSTVLRERAAMMRERWAGLPAGRRRAVIAVACLVLLVLLLRRRGAPLIQINVEVEFEPVATTAMSLFGPASVGDAPVAEER